MAQIQEQKQQGSCGSSSADAGDCSFPVSPLADRLFELLGVDRATVQYAVRMAPPVSSTNALQVAHLISSQFWLDEVSCVSIWCWHAVLCRAVLCGSYVCHHVTHTDTIYAVCAYAAWPYSIIVCCVCVPLCQLAESVCVSKAHGSSMNPSLNPTP
jgi:hypothetical protein